MDAFSEIARKIVLIGLPAVALLVIVILLISASDRHPPRQSRPGAEGPDPDEDVNGNGDGNGGGDGPG